MLSVHVHRTQPVAVPSFAVRGLTFLVFFFLSWRDNWNLGGRKCELIYRIHRKYTIISRIIFSIWQLYLACLNRHESNPSIPILPKSNPQHLWLYFRGVLMIHGRVWNLMYFASPMGAAEPMFPVPAPGQGPAAGQLSPAAIFVSNRSPRRQSVCLCARSKVV